MELQAQVDALKKQGLGLAGISYDSQEILADFSKRHGITYPLLSDVGSATIRRYGILNTVVEEALGPNGKDPAVRADLQVFATVNEPTERLRGIPFPGIFLALLRGLLPRADHDVQPPAEARNRPAAGPGDAGRYRSPGAQDIPQ